MTRFFSLKTPLVYKVRMIAAPPFTPTYVADRKYYTIHSANNNALTLRVSNTDKMAMVGFQTLNDAVLIGNMIETYYTQNMEWPELRDIESLVLPTGHLNELTNVFMKSWEFEELKYECTRNILDMVSVEEIVKNNDKYSLQGSLYTFSAPPEFYMERFEELLKSSDTR